MTLAEFRDVSFAYEMPTESRARPFALRDVSFAITPAEIIGVIGPNSSGKTTLIRLLTRVLEPASGEIRLEGVPIGRMSRTNLARRVAVVPQGILPQFPFTVGELVLMGRYPHDPGRYFESPRDRAVARDAMEATGVLELADMPLEHLSGGERGMTVLLVSHDLNLAAEVCDRLLLLNGGRPTAIGPPAAVLDEALLASVFGCAVLVDKNEATGRPVVRLTWRTDSAEAESGRGTTVRPGGKEVGETR